MASATVGDVYEPQAFREHRDDVVLDLVRTAGFGHLVVTHDGALTSTPVPFVADDELTTVRAHLARPNSVWRAAPCDALLIVPVTDAYVSPGWYPSKAEHGRVVPTWNYEVVHLHGRLVAHDDAEWVRRQITALTDTNEAAFPSPWAVTDAPDDHITKLVRAIVGVELTVDRVDAKRKLSQNRGDDDRAGVRRGLGERDDRSRAVASAMEEHEEDQ
ncbi:PaiB family negative transcriptional regulator [Ilumatobacter fluminis]|uniref:PaiB family negative transcriptional regulator n=1 Tax=Ilumatobacter fluminis TaxID=467091 RepID=A0A4R7I3V4_9ACTN|nr:PaiB family negative transcriptional regulator [Ilumatobacter fluminis]